MRHGLSWISFLPGYQKFEHYIQSISNGLLFANTPIVQHVFSAILVFIILLFVSFRARKQLKSSKDSIIPPPEISLRNIIELILETLYGLSKQIIGKDAALYFPVIGSLALFIFFSNILGLIPGFIPPTDNWNTTFACGGFVFLYYNYQGLKKHGFGHIVHMANPAGEWWGWFLSPLMFPIEIVSHFTRPFSLGVRLATNMIADHAVLFAF